MTDIKNEQTLANKVAVVTGGNRGIGAAIAQKLAEIGASVVICGRNHEALKAAAASISQKGGSCLALECDLSQWDSVERMAAQVRQKHGRIDILVNNAGVGSFSTPLHKLPLEQWDKVLNTNLRGVYFCIRALAPLMIERGGGGDIINISSLAGKNPLPNGAAYAASKWGLNGLTYSVAEELRSHNIRVSVVCPGSVNTELSTHEGKNPDRMLQPADVAHVVEMLVTQRSQSFASEVLLRPTQKP